MMTLGDFTRQAKAYARGRPSYPSEMVGLLLDLFDLTPGDPIADLGAGTGILTEVLSRYELRITAVEPNSAMRDEAGRIDGVEWHNGTFEKTGLASTSQKWLVAAQAFHWAEPKQALPELHRILVPGAPLSVLWNNRDIARSPELMWTHELIEELVPGFDEGYRNRDWEAVLTSTGHFECPFLLEVPHVITMDVERYLDLWRSHHLLNRAAGPEGMRELLGKIESRLDKTRPIDLPYLCRVWTVVATTDGAQKTDDHRNG